jgi:PTS system mannose-specific IID component
MIRYPVSVRARIFLRSFLIQGSWNYETLIGSGFAFTLLPALRHLRAKEGKTEAELEEAVARHVGLFNSHPYFATIAVGAVGKMEADGVPPAVIDRFKLALRGSLGSLGDRLIWSAWRPMTAILGVVLLLGGAPWWLAVSCFLVFYNFLHLTVRARGLRVGGEKGLELGVVLRDAPIQPLVERAWQIACGLIGLGVVLAASPAASGIGMQVATVLVASAFGLALGRRTRNVLIVILWATVITALLLGLLGYGA